MHSIQKKSQDDFCRDLINHVTSAPVVAFIVVGYDAVKNLMELAGDVDPEKACLKSPMSLRSVYGKNIILGGVDVSETQACVYRVRR